MTPSPDPREALLAPYAQKASESSGRLLREAEHPFRSSFQRDRDRIVHGTSFRRLDGKTQVFLNGKGDHYRTRLTHTIEVASVSRTVARALGLNEDLAEAIALAHDLGHPPFGHAGEETLDLLMKEHGGFDHNEQSLRVVETLEESYPHHPGLNLSHEVLEGLKKHHRELLSPDGMSYPSPSLEAQVANIADEIAYSPELKSRNAALRRHLYERFYRHPEVHGANENACRQMEAVFADLMNHPEKLGERTLSRRESDGLPRVVADYVAGMTDSYLRTLYTLLA